MPRKYPDRMKDMDVATFPWDEVERLAGLGMRRITEIASVLDIPAMAISNKRSVDNEFRNRFDAALGMGRGEATERLLQMLWGKAEEGDRAAMISLLNRVSPDDMVASKDHAEWGMKIENAVIMTNAELMEKLASEKEKLRFHREVGYMAVEEEEDGRAKG